MDAIKNDRKDGKLMWELLPLEIVEHIVAVFTFGAKKYAPWSWDKLPNGYERYKAAFLRHVLAFEKGEWLDNESHLPHLAHAMWNACAMFWFGKCDNERGMKESDRRNETTLLHEYEKKKA